MAIDEVSTSLKPSQTRFDLYEESRCKIYGTTIYSCSCPGYSFRKMCRHVEYLRNKLVGKQIDTPVITDGEEAIAFVEKYGEEMLEKMKVVGDVFERHGKLYRLV